MLSPKSLSNDKFDVCRMLNLEKWYQANENWTSTKSHSSNRQPTQPAMQTKRLSYLKQIAINYSHNYYLHIKMMNASHFAFRIPYAKCPNAICLESLNRWTVRFDANEKAFKSLLTNYMVRMLFGGRMRCIVYSLQWVLNIHGPVIITIK